MNKIKFNRREEKGATIIEFALVIGLLLLLVFGIIDFSRFMSAKSVMRKATQAAVRQASTIDGINIFPGNPTVTAGELKEMPTVFHVRF